MEDRTLVCDDCGDEFMFSADDQEFFNEKGFDDPKRCKPCRDKRKASRHTQKQMHDTTCADCGAPTQVPFVPTGDRPVYCRDCFAMRR